MLKQKQLPRVTKEISYAISYNLKEYCTNVNKWLDIQSILIFIFRYSLHP